MTIDVPYQIGDTITISGETYTIKGIHIYVTQDSNVITWRFHVGGGRFVSLDTPKKHARRVQ